MSLSHRTPVAAIVTVAYCFYYCIYSYNNVPSDNFLPGVNGFSIGRETFVERRNQQGHYTIVSHDNKQLLQQKSSSFYQHGTTRLNRLSSSSTSPSESASIVDDVMNEMKIAMKSKDTTRLNTIRLIRSAFANAAIELRTEKLSDSDALSVLKKLAKMRKESIDMFTKGGAIDRANMEQLELDIISTWLPQSVSEDVVRSWVVDAISEIQSQTKPVLNMGKVMGLLMKYHKDDNIDGSLAQTIVKEELAKLQ